MRRDRRFFFGQLRSGIAAALAALACSEPAADFPGRRLAERVEAEVARRRPELVASLSHYGLLFPVEPAQLESFMSQVRVFAATDPVLGTDHGLEPHGGGLLALLFDHWRPNGRRARMEDRFGFAPRGPSVPLGTLYAALERQVFLPGDSAELPRIRLQAAGLPPVEVDAYHFLRLLTVQEADLERSWTNRFGQRLSALGLLERARRSYLESRDTPGAPSDHTRLHLVEVLLAASRRLGTDPGEIKKHFLTVELRREAFDPDTATELLGHHVESLGLLLADERVQFDAEERIRVRDWLTWLEASHFRDLDRVEICSLSHLLRGLRLVGEQHRRLAPSGGASATSAASGGSP